MRGRHQPSVLERLVCDWAWAAEDWQGYAALGQVPCPIPGLAGPTLELARLCVVRPWQGRGTANRLTARFIQEVQERGGGGRSLWLQAFGGGPRALACYCCWGFETTDRSFSPPRGCPCRTACWEGTSRPKFILNIGGNQMLVRI